MKLRAAIIGCGDIAGGYDERKNDRGCYTHAGAYRRFLSEVDLVAAVDTNPNRLKQFGRFWKVANLCRDMASFLKHPPFDIVSVCLPDGLHARFVTQLLNRRPPRVVFVEKPLALTGTEARALLDLAKIKGTRVVVNCQRRWEEGHRRLRRFLQTGGIGRHVTSTARYVKGLRHIGTTSVNTVRFLLSDIERVQALGTPKKVIMPKDPSQDALLHLKCGGSVFLAAADRVGYTYSLFELDILGTRGRVQITENGDRITLFRSQAYAHYSGFRELVATVEQPFESRMGEAIPQGVQQILGFLRGRSGEWANDGEEGLQDLRVVDAIHLSAVRGGRVLRL